MAATATLMSVPAGHLEPGDTIVADGAIDIRVDLVNDHPLRAGFVIVSYSIPGTDVTGDRAFVALQNVTARRADEEGH